MNASTSSSTDSFNDPICENTSNNAEDGHLTFNIKDMKWKLSVARLIDDRAHQSNKLFLINSLRQRELHGSGLMCNRIRYKKPLYKMNVRHNVRNAKTKQISAEFAPIDKKGMYLGLSHDSAYLVELCVEGVDPYTMISFLDCAVATGDESTFTFVIHAVTPQYLHPRYVLNLGHRSLLSVFYGGFSLDQRIFVSHCFSTNELKHFTEGTFTDSVHVDVALMEHHIHISLQVVMNMTVKKRDLSKNSYFRILKGGFAFDTGTEIVAVLFHDDDMPSDSGDSQQIYRIRRRTNVDGQVVRLVQGVFLRNVAVRSSLPNGGHPTASRRGENLITAELPVYELTSMTVEAKAAKVASHADNTTSASSASERSVFMTETSLNADRVISTVVRSVLKTRLQNHKFMGITAAEAYIIGVRDHIVNVIVIGVIELQSTRYVFSRVAIELDWNLQKPDKMSLINLSVREINWLTATRGEWHPPRLQVQRNVEDRLLTNEVTESLNCLVGTLPGGMYFTA